MNLTVERNGTEIYTDTFVFREETDAVVAGFTRESLPEGDRAVTVRAVGGGQSASVEVRISECLGDVVFFYEEGSMQGTDSIC